MASASSLPDITPGLLKQTDLAINKEQLSDADRRQATCKLEQLQIYCESSRDCPHQYAILNLIAVFHFRLGKAKDAEQVLKEVVDKDPTNIHAWQDLATICKRKYVVKEANKCEERLKEELGKIGGDNKNESDLVHARYLAGLALASAFDLHIDTKGTSRLDKSIDLYETALVKGAGVIDGTEEADWMYYLALDYIRLNNVRKLSGSETSYHDTFDRTFDCLEPSLKSDNVHRSSSALSLLANLFSQKPRSMSAIPEIIKNSDFRQYWGNPQGCFLRALEFNGDNWIALNRLARLLYDDNREEKAMEMLEKSLCINPGSSNHMARRVRARIYRLNFNKLWKRGDNPDTKLLSKALIDLKKCIDTNPYALDMIHLAEIYHKLSWEPGKPHNEDYLDKALECCAEAESCQDGAMRPELHQRRALILQDMQDHESAVKCFMQAMDCESPGTKNSKNFIYMYNGMLKRFKELENPKYLLQQLVYWLEKGMRKYEKLEDKTRSKKSKMEVKQKSNVEATGGNPEVETEIQKSTVKVSYFINRCPEEMIQVVKGLSSSKKRYQLEIAQKCIKTFQDKKISCSLPIKALDELCKEVADNIQVCSSTGSERADSLKLDITSAGSVSSRKSSQESSSRSFDKKTKSVTSGHLDRLKVHKGSDDGSHLQDTGHPKSIPSTNLCATCGAQTADLSSQRSDVKTDTSQSSISDGGDKSSIRSLSDIPPASPESMPLSRLLSSDETVAPPEASHSPSTCANQDGTPSSTQTPSFAGSAGSYFVDICFRPQCVGGKEKEVKTTFSMTKDQFTYQKLLERLNQVLDQTDLRPDDIGDAPETAQHTAFKYDFYAVYDNESNSATAFTFYHLRPQLEEGQSRLKGCFDIRDFQAGRSIYKNMADALEHSAKVLFLVSENFFQNPSCDKILSMALTSRFRSKLVPVLLDHVTLPIELEDVHFIDARTTINWGHIRKHLDPLGSQST